MARFVLALDQGTTSSRSILFRRSGRIAGVAQREFPQLFPSPGHVEHDPEAIWQSQIRTARAAIKNARAKASDIDAIGITNQREDCRALGRRHRQADRQRVRVAEPNHGSPMRSAQEQGPRRHGARQDRTRHRSVLLRHQDPGLARQAQTPGSSQAWQGPRRHHRHVPAVPPDRRSRARDRLQQRQPHAAVQHPHPRVGSGATGSLWRSPRHAAGGQRLERHLRPQREEAARRRAAHRRRGWRSAGGHLRPGLFFARVWSRTPTALAASC